MRHKLDQSWSMAVYIVCSFTSCAKAGCPDRYVRYRIHSTRTNAERLWSGTSSYSLVANSAIEQQWAGKWKL